MVQLYYLRLHLGIEALSCRLLQWIARMDTNSSFSSFKTVPSKITLKVIMVDYGWCSLVKVV